MSDIELEELVERLDELRVVDVRSEGEFDGSAGYPCDPRHGHIPGAANLDVRELVSLSDDDLRARLGEPADGEVVVYCHSGSRSDTAAQVLRRAGYEVRNYRGSWHEWSRTELPAE
jgi:thiosulfate/3-mercaptopyruvate sulfurtransferase